MIVLETDQITSINATSAAFRRAKAVLLQGATGSGKSYMASEMVRLALSRNKSVWFLVPRRDLIRQMHETFMAFGLSHGYIAAGYDYDPFAQLHICSTDTIKGRLDRLQPPQLAIIDETHFGGEGLDKIVKWLKSHGCYILGLSATPWKLSGKGLCCWYDEMVCGPSVRWLIDNKRLSEYKAFAPNRPDLSGIAVTGGDYAKGQLSERMEQDRVLIGNSVKHYKQHAMGTLGITFAVSRKHSELLAESYRDAGIPAMHMDGETPEPERIRIAKAYARRELLQLCNAELLTFGYDLASASGIKNVCIQTMTDCQPTKSLAKQRQKNGRFLRYDGETHTLFDHANNIQEHGLPCCDIPWTLADREKKSGGGERSLPVRQCTACFFCFSPAPVCPNCKFVFPIESRIIEEVDGELAEIQIAKEKKIFRQTQGKARSLDDLIAIGKERGYKNPIFWAKKVMAGRKQ